MTMLSSNIIRSLIKHKNVIGLRCYLSRILEICIFMCNFPLLLSKRVMGIFAILFKKYHQSQFVFKIILF